MLGHAYRADVRRRPDCSARAAALMHTDTNRFRSEIGRKPALRTLRSGRAAKFGPTGNAKGIAMDRRTWKEPMDERIVADGVFLEQRAVLCITRGVAARSRARRHGLDTEEGRLHDTIVKPGKWYRLQTDALAIVYDGDPPPSRSRRRSESRRAGRSRAQPRTAGPTACTASGPASAAVVPAVTSGPWCCVAHRSGAGRARRGGQSVADAARRDDIAGSPPQLDARTRRDIGLEQFHSASPAERAEQYRWRHDSWPTRESRFI
jgi:hypothetical protein